MPPLPEESLRKYLPDLSCFAITFIEKKELCKIVAYFLLLSLVGCIPYWTLTAIYLDNHHFYTNKDLQYCWIYIRCFWNCTFLLLFYHPIFHISPHNIMCLMIFVFLLFDGFDSLFSHYYFYYDRDSSFDKTVSTFFSFKSYKNTQVCELFNCDYLNLYHFMSFAITFPFMFLFGFLVTVIYLQCFTIYGSNKKMRKSTSLFGQSITNLSKEIGIKDLKYPKTFQPISKAQRNSIDGSNFLLNYANNSLQKSKLNVMDSNDNDDDNGSEVSSATLNAEPKERTSSLLSIEELDMCASINSTGDALIVHNSSATSLLLGADSKSELQKSLKYRKTLKNPSIDSTNLSAWYGSQMFRRKSLDDLTILELMRFESENIPISRDDLGLMFRYIFSLSVMIFILFFAIYLWLFVKKSHVHTAMGSLIVYSLLLSIIVCFSAIFNKITVEMDKIRKYMYDISVQLLVQIFIDALYWSLYRYTTFNVLPIMVTSNDDSDQWFDESIFLVIIINFFYKFMIPSIIASETVYNYVVTKHESIPCIVRSFLTFVGIDIVSNKENSNLNSYQEWKERYSLLFVVTMLCSLFSFIAFAGLAICAYSVLDDVKHNTDLHKGTVYVLLSFVIECVSLLAINSKIFDGAMIEPMLRLYELNPKKLSFTICCIFASTVNMFGLTLYQHTLAGIKNSN